MLSHLWSVKNEIASFQNIVRSFVIGCSRRHVQRGFDSSQQSAQVLIRSNVCLSSEAQAVCRSYAVSMATAPVMNCHVACDYQKVAIYQQLLRILNVP